MDLIQSCQNLKSSDVKNNLDPLSHHPVDPNIACADPEGRGKCWSPSETLKKIYFSLK